MKVEMHATLNLVGALPDQDPITVGDRVAEETHGLEGVEGHDFYSVGYAVLSGRRLEIDIDRDGSPDSGRALGELVLARPPRRRSGSSVGNCVVA